MNKSDLLTKLHAQNTEWEALLAEIGPARMDLPGVNGAWTMKDILAHLTGWNRKLAADLQAAQRGEAVPPPPWPAALQSEDDINAWIHAAYRAQPVGEVLAGMRQAHQQILAVIEALPDDARIEPVEPVFHVVWVGGTRFNPSEFFDHFRDDHEPEVRAWLARAEKP
ncbi:MAG: maleylpyruvate isomerase N-terminal domain-containing protein [Anaerolineales bacterium]